MKNLLLCYLVGWVASLCLLYDLTDVPDEEAGTMTQHLFILDLAAGGGIAVVLILIILYKRK